MPAFTISIFLSAFLLFTIQPLLTKKLLPLFGSSPSIWLCNVLFFQTMLLIGYLYAFFLTKISKISLQIAIHVTLLMCSLFFLPISPIEKATSLWPPLAILARLTATVFLPGMIISASSPLFQHWYGQCYQTEFPYRYYALSSFGSLLGLLAFPFVLEPTLALKTQLIVWSGLYGLYLVSSALCLMILSKNNSQLSFKQTNHQSKNSMPNAWVHWLLLTLLSSALLLSTTQITLQDIASFPLLWVIPLALYLISFIITFYHAKCYYRPLWIILYTLFSAFVFYLKSHHELSLTLQIVIYSSLLFSGCMVCHGELFRLKPDKQDMTTYYLFIALGGVLGGLFINVIAVLFFNDLWDFYLTIFGIFILSAYLCFYYPKQKVFWLQVASWIAGFSTLSALLFFHLQYDNQNVILKARNFFGTMEVVENNLDIKDYHYRTLRHGNIMHGHQFLEGEKRFLATSYYSHLSGIGYAIYYERLLKNDSFFKGLRIGVIGLGTGTIAALTFKGDLIRFYEIDPDIEKIAQQYFSYLADTKAFVDIIIGDGRLSLAQTFEKKGSENYDVLAIDAFNGDAIPVHLLTLEAVKIYLAHLSPKGIIAFHVSSRYLDLNPPLQAIAKALNLYAYIARNDGDKKNWIASAEWILLTSDPELGAFLYQKQALDFRPQRMAIPWTDDFNYLLSIVRW